jgi:hypothetical protein
MKSILIICFTDLKSDARVTRQVNFVKDTYRVTVACFDAHRAENVEYFFLKNGSLTLTKKLFLSFFLLGRMYKIAYKLLYGFESYVPKLRQRKFDLILANDFETLPFAFQIADNHSKVFFDAHEYAPRQFEDRLYWRVFFQKFIQTLCRKYIPRVSGMSTINNGIAKAYKQEFGISSIIITNASDFVGNMPLKREGLPIRLVHHGIYTLSRQPHLMIDMMKMLGDKFTLDLIYLIPSHASRSTRQSFDLLKKNAEESSNIKVLPALKSAEIVPYLHEHYDMGIILVPPVNFNYQNGLPNKLFDCIQARIAMCVGPLHEIASVVNGYEIGIVSKGFTPSEMAQELQHLTLDKLNAFKENTNKAASQMNAENNKKILLYEIQQILAKD